MVYQAGNKAGQIDATITSLQKTTEEIRAELKARDDRFNAASSALQKTADESRKATDELKTSLKGHSDDITRLQAAVDHLNGGIDKINDTVTKMIARMQR
jgi:ABC-type transporter Mla subunit MlaD